MVDLILFFHKLFCRHKVWIERVKRETKEVGDSIITKKYYVCNRCGKQETRTFINRGGKNHG